MIAELEATVGPIMTIFLMYFVVNIGVIISGRILISIPHLPSFVKPAVGAVVLTTVGAGIILFPFAGPLLKAGKFSHIVVLTGIFFLGTFIEVYSRTKERGQL
jgi:hypothetical protein